jgi:P27 family predicted phage terminase small subunit
MSRPGPGRPPLPANVIKMRGASDAKVAERQAQEIRPDPITPRPPKGLSALERECWDLHAPELERFGLLTRLDITSFRLVVCGPYEMAMTFRDAMRPKKADGTPDRRRKALEVVVADAAHHGTPRRHPAYIGWKDSVKAYLAGCREFGLTPSSRVGLRPMVGPAPILDDEDDDLFGDAEFFGDAP